MNFKEFLSLSNTHNISFYECDVVLNNNKVYKINDENNSFAIVESKDDLVLVKLQEDYNKIVVDPFDSAKDLNPLDYYNRGKVIALSEVDTVETFLSFIDECITGKKLYPNKLTVATLIAKIVKDKVDSYNSNRINNMFIEKPDYCNCRISLNTVSGVFIFETLSKTKVSGTSSLLALFYKNNNSGSLIEVCSLDDYFKESINIFIDKCARIISRGKDYIEDYIALGVSKNSTNNSDLEIFINKLDNLTGRNYNFILKSNSAEVYINYVTLEFYSDDKLGIIVKDFTNNKEFSMLGVCDGEDFDFFAMFIGDYIDSELLNKNVNDENKYKNLYRVWKVADRIASNSLSSYKLAYNTFTDTYPDVHITSLSDDCTLGKGVAIWGTLFDDSTDEVHLSITDMNDSSLNIKFGIHDVGDTEDDFINHASSEVIDILKTQSTGNKNNLESQIDSIEDLSTLDNEEKAIREVLDTYALDIKEVFERVVSEAIIGGKEVSIIDKDGTSTLVLETYYSKISIEFKNSKGYLNEDKISIRLISKDNKFNPVYIITDESADDIDKTVDLFERNLKKFLNNDKQDSCSDYRLVVLRYNSKVVGYRFKKGNKGYDISIETAKNLGVSSFKVTKSISLIDCNGLLMSKSEIESGRCCEDISDNIELVENLFSQVIGNKCKSLPSNLLK